ncbi:MAG: carboxypeptidase-like regulatory domain-containing protein [Cyclobacteriaceae bacterium]|nr:carboxypeptidase-like regulatory domain-containing protein [Cyclobacteriaceae bacterium]
MDTVSAVWLSISWRDKDSAGGTIIIKDLDLAISTNATGEFEITLTEGYHLAEVRMVGYDSRTFSLNILGSSEWNIELLPEATELDEVLVRSSADNNNVTAVFAGVTTLNPVELREMPVFLGEPDVIKSILTLPGIAQSWRGASGFNVRGGNIDQNLILQENALVFNSSHAMGFFSIFNPDAIKEVTLYKGHIPAQYGGRVSSVLDVQLKGNNYEMLKLKRWCRTSCKPVDVGNTDRQRKNILACWKPCGLLRLDFELRKQQRCAAKFTRLL